MFKKIDSSYVEKLEKEYCVPSLISILKSAFEKEVYIEVIEVPGEDKRIFKLNKDGKFFYIFNTNSYSSMGGFGKVMTKDKYFSCYLMSANGIPTPVAYLKNDFEPILEKKYVSKPRFGGKGRGISMFYGSDWNSENYNDSVVIQEFKEGGDLRIQIVGGEIFAACVREPANVIGNGVNKISDLIDYKNERKLKQNRILKNDKTEEFLKKQGLSFDSVLGKNEKVYLRELSNISLGGDIIDVTEKIHSSYTDLVKKLVEVFKERNFAIDMITKNLEKPIEESEAVVIELNSPNMWYHHLLAEPTGRDVGDAILEDWLANPDLY